MLELEISVQNGYIIIHLIGDLTLVESQQFISTLYDALQNRRIVILNFDKLDYMDSRGIGALLKVVEFANSCGTNLMLSNLSTTVLDVIRRVGVQDKLKIFRTFEKALKSLGGEG